MSGEAAAIVNRKARHLYEIGEKIEAGLALAGSEVKSLRAGHASIAEAHAGPVRRGQQMKNQIKNKSAAGELYLFNAYIGDYPPAAQAQHPNRRPRKLLLRKREISRITAEIREKGLVLVPLTMFFNPRGIAKIELGLGKRLKKYDRRDRDKKRDWQRHKEILVRRKS